MLSERKNFEVGGIVSQTAIHSKGSFFSTPVVKTLPRGIGKSRVSYLVSETAFSITVQRDMTS